MACNEVLHLGRRCVLESVSADEVVGDFVLLGVGLLAIALGNHDAIPGAIGCAVSVCLCHCCYKLNLMRPEGLRKKSRRIEEVAIVSCQSDFRYQVRALKLETWGIIPDSESD